MDQRSYSDPVAKLFDAGDPRESSKWFAGEPNYPAEFDLTAEHNPKRQRGNDERKHVAK